MRYVLQRWHDLWPRPLCSGTCCLTCCLFWRLQEDYYYSEYTPAEKELGHHLAASNFVSSPFQNPAQ